MSDHKFSKISKKATIIGAFCCIGLSGCATVSGGTPPAGPAEQPKNTDATRQIETAVNRANRVYNAVDRARWMVEDMRRWGR